MDDMVKSYMEDNESDHYGIASKISSGDSSFLDMVESLQQHLTSTEVDKRMRACELISNVLSNLHKSVIKPQESAVIVNFLCCRLQDHFSVHSPALAALAVMSSYENLPPGSAELILRTVFKEIHAPSYMQSVRRSIYVIIAGLLENYKLEVLAMGDDFVYGFISTVDGEQDPRNLLHVFDLAYIVIKTGFDISKCVEEFFDVIGCYFPIDFEPPPSLTDRKVITNEQLVQGLRKVISSTHLLAPHCIPLMIEKMESNILNAKLDAMRTLKDCLEVYSVIDLRMFLRSLWVCIRRETVYAQTESIEIIGQSLVTDIVSILSKSSTSSSDGSNPELDSFLKDVLEECLPKLTGQLQEKMSWSSAKLVIAGAKASKLSCRMLLREVLPVLMVNLENKNLNIAERRLTLEVLINVLKTISEFVFTAEFHPLHDHKNDVVEFICSCVASDSFQMLRTVAFAGLAALCDHGSVLSAENKLKIVQSIVYCIRHDQSDQLTADLRATAGYLSMKWSDLAVEHIFPVISKSIENLFISDVHLLKKDLLYLSSISTHPDVIKVTSELLLKAILSETVNERTSEHFEVVLDCIADIVNANARDQRCIKYFSEAVVLPLVKICVKMSLVPVLPEQCCSCCSELQNFSSQCITQPVMQKAANILRTVCQNMKSDKQAQDLCDALTAVFVDCDLKRLDVESAQSYTFSPLTSIEQTLQTRLVSLLVATHCSFVREVKIKCVDDLLDALLNLSQKTTDQLSYVSASKCIAGLINKQKVVPEDFMNKVLKLGKTVAHHTSSLDTSVRTLSLLVWFVKCLALRSHEKTMEFTSILFSLFSDRNLGRMSADSFDIILRDTEEVLNSASHAVIRLMYRQRFFQSALPILIHGFQTVERDGELAMETDQPYSTDSSAAKANYLTALSHFLMYLPKQVLHQHLASLLPMLVKSLKSNEGPLLESVLSTLYSLVQEDESSIEPHAKMLLDHFIELASLPTYIQVRIQACRCIGVMTILPVSVILPHKQRIIKALAKPIDDNKRLVRKEASKARSEWCLLGDV